tara:strand:- start:3866 stop:4402 length:537 start_codon:yes stop_codon:yes gene_type:complete
MAAQKVQRSTTYKKLLISGSSAELSTLLLSGLSTGVTGSTLVIDGEGNVGVGSGFTPSGSSSGSDYTEWATYTGTRAGVDLDLTLGDYDDSGNGTNIRLKDAESKVEIEGNVETTGSLVVKTEVGGTDFFIIKSGSTENLKVNSQGIVEFFAYEIGYVPTAKLGGLYFTSSSVWVGLQ